VVNRGLRQHAVVLELALAERRSVGGDDNQLGFARTEGLDGRLVAQSDCSESMVRKCENLNHGELSRRPRG